MARPSCLRSPLLSNYRNCADSNASKTCALNSQNGNASEQAAAQRPGTFQMKAMINAHTGIMCVTLPVFDREKPMKGTKAARVSILNAEVLHVLAIVGA